MGKKWKDDAEYLQARINVVAKIIDCGQFMPAPSVVSDWAKYAPIRELEDSFDEAQRIMNNSGAFIWTPPVVDREALRRACRERFEPSAWIALATNEQLKAAMDMGTPTKLSISFDPRLQQAAPDPVSVDPDPTQASPDPHEKRGRRKRKANGAAPTPEPDPVALIAPAADPDRVEIVPGSSLRRIEGARAELVPAIDGKYRFDERVARPLVAALEHNLRAMLVGPRGCGKSSVVEQVCARAGWPFCRINMNGEITVADFIGHWIVDGERRLVYQHGVLPQAMREGAVLLVDEIAASTPEVMFIMQRVAEEGGVLQIPENGGEIVEPHKNFRIVAADNTVGLGDASGMYTGTHVMNASQLDRYHMVLTCDYLPSDTETDVIVAKSRIDRDKADTIVAFAQDIRQARVKGEVYYDMSLRRLLAYASLWVILDSQVDALRLTILNGVGDADRPVITEVAQRRFGAA